MREIGLLGPAEDAVAEEFSDLFARTAIRVRGYLRRHCDAPDLDDLLSEVYLVAWRRGDEVPEDPLPWLLAVARRVLANYWRGRDRRERLSTELRCLHGLASEPDVAGCAVTRATMLDALAGLTAADRELLLLVGWDGLDSEALARVLGCSAGAARTRLNRARQRLEDGLAVDRKEGLK